MSGSRVDVLEVLVGAVAGFLHAGEEVVEVARLECVHQLVNALVLVEEVYRTEHRPVAELLAQYADIQHDVVLGELTEGIAGEVSRNRLHLLRDSCVLGGEVCVVALGVDYAQRVAELLEISGYAR